MKRMVTAAAVMAFGVAAAAAQTVCDVRTYGAKGDGATKDTVAIQKAIDTCSAKKGTVKLAGGDFVSGPLEVKSDVTDRCRERCEAAGVGRPRGLQEGHADAAADGSAVPSCRQCG